MRGKKCLVTDPWNESTSIHIIHSLQFDKRNLFFTRSESMLSCTGFSRRISNRISVLFSSAPTVFKREPDVFPYHTLAFDLFFFFLLVSVRFSFIFCCCILIASDSFARRLAFRFEFYLFFSVQLYYVSCSNAKRSFFIISEKQKLIFHIFFSLPPHPPRVFSLHFSDCRCRSSCRSDSKNFKRIVSSVVIALWPHGERCQSNGTLPVTKSKYL